MPVFEYVCRPCEHVFEKLVLRSEPSSCPKCGAADPQRMISAPRVKSSATRGMAMRAARRRDAKQARDRMHERIRYEQSHDRHG